MCPHTGFRGVGFGSWPFRTGNAFCASTQNYDNLLETDAEAGAAGHGKEVGIHTEGGWNFEQKV